MSLKWPILLFLLVFPLLALIWRRFKKPLVRPVFVSESELVKSLPSFKKATKRIKLYKYFERLLLASILVTLVLLSSRPLLPSVSYSTEKSRDIVLLLDVSGSMKEFIPPMIDVMEEVVKNNPSERYSIVTFAGYSNTVLPLTRDPVAIKESFALLRKVYKDGNDPNYAFRSLNGGSTDIGEGVLGAVNKFDNLELKKSRNIILLSDLENTGGPLDSNAEYYLDKVGLIPKYKINFYLLKAPSEFKWGVNDEIAKYGGAVVYDIDKKNSQSSVHDMSRKIFSQILNSSQSINRNFVDSPNILILLLIILSIFLITIRFIRWLKL